MSENATQDKTTTSASRGIAGRSIPTVYDNALTPAILSTALESQLL